MKSWMRVLKHFIYRFSPENFLTLVRAFNSLYRLVYGGTDLADYVACAALVVRARSGDRAAYEQLCEQFATRVWKIANAIATGPDAEDIAQDAIIKGWRAIGTCSNAITFEAWICRITVNAGRDYLKSAWKRRVVSLVTGGPVQTETVPAAAVVAERRAEVMRVRKAVMKLPPGQSVPIWLHYFEGLTLKEIAEIENAPESTIRSRMKVGLARLSIVLEDLNAPNEELLVQTARSNEI